MQAARLVGLDEPVTLSMHDPDGTLDALILKLQLRRSWNKELSSAAALNCLGRRVNEIGNSFLNTRGTARGSNRVRISFGMMAHDMIGEMV